MPLFGISGSPQAILSTAPDSWVGVQTLRGIGSNRTRLYVDVKGDLWGQFENNPPKLIAGLGSTSTAAVNTVPIGAVFQWTSGTAPTGYLMCNGSSFSAGFYPLLAAILGNTFGGASKLPNFAGRVIVGAGNRDYTDPWPGALAVGAKGGSVRHQLKPHHLPFHSHTIEEAGGEHSHTLTVLEHSHTVSGNVASHAHSIDVTTSTPWDMDATPVATDLNHKHEFDGWTRGVDAVDGDNNVLGRVFTHYESGGVNYYPDWTGEHTHTDVDVESDEVTVTTESAGGHSHTISIASAGTHNHTVDTVSAGDHTHTVDTGSAGGHDHTLTVAGEGTHEHSVTVAASGAHAHDAEDATVDTVAAHTHTVSAVAAGAHDHTLSITSVGNHSHLIDGELDSHGAHSHDQGSLVNADVANHTHAAAGGYTSTSDGAHTHTLDFELGDNLDQEDPDLADYAQVDARVVIGDGGDHSHTTTTAGAHDHTITVTDDLNISDTLAVADKELTSASVDANLTHTLETANKELTSATVSGITATDIDLDTGTTTLDDAKFPEQTVIADAPLDPDDLDDIWFSDQVLSTWQHNQMVDFLYYDSGSFGNHYAIESTPTAPTFQEISHEHVHGVIIPGQAVTDTAHDHTVGGSITVGGGDLAGTEHNHTITGGIDIDGADVANTNHNHNLGGTISLNGSITASDATAGGHSHSTNTAGGHDHEAEVDTHIDIKLTNKATSSAGAHTHTITVTETAAGGHDHVITGTTSTDGSHDHDVDELATTLDGTHTHAGDTSTAAAHTHTISAATAGAHLHTVSFEEDGGHTHTGTVATSGTHTHTATAADAGSHTHTGDAASAGAHTHAGDTDDGGAHIHGGSSNSTGGHTHTINFDDFTLDIAKDIEVPDADGGDVHTRTDLIHGHNFKGTTHDSYDAAQDAEENDSSLNHTHNIDETTSYQDPAFSGTSNTVAEETYTSSSESGAHDHGGRTGAEGSDASEPLEVIQPWIAINYIIKHD